MRSLIIGSTGTVGSRVVQRLLKRNETVRCMSRQLNKMQNMPQTVERIVADLEKPHTLPEAFRGVDNLFLISPVSRTETEQGLNAVAAARAAGIRKIVYMSVYMPFGSDVIPHFLSKIPIENAVKTSGIPYTILRPNNFFQNDIAIIGIVMAYGIYPTPVGKIGLNRIDAGDIADCAVNALIEAGHEGLVYNLHGAETLNGRDMARIYSNYVGRDVRYAGDDLDVWVQHVKNVMPDWLSADMRVMFKYFQDHGMIAPEADLERQSLIMGHAPRPFDDFAREIAGEWKNSLACAA